MALYIQESDNLGHYPVLPNVPADLKFDAWVADDSGAFIEAEIELASALPQPNLLPAFVKKSSR